MKAHTLWKQLALAGCLLTSSLAQGAETLTTANMPSHERPMATERADEQQARDWGLNVDEWTRYRDLMQGPLGIYSPNLDPLTALGIEAFPAGVVSVITSPSMEGDADVDVSCVPSSNPADYAAPIVVSIGSVRVLPSIDASRSIVGTPVLNYSISFDNRATSVVEARKFCAKLQKYLRNPALLEAKAAPVAPAGENPTRRKSFLK